ncbi:hypothetical protein B0A56_00625 [Flavobacterium columnare NBRC 100251 = ATCC 23463]|nr:hypothetical protein B0A56_00625 [Flavobacterium columnare NBRC 100251 = ATCC 23463]
MKKITTQVADNLEVVIIPSADHEFLMTSKEVATAYGISDVTIRRHIQENTNDLIEGKHFVKGVTILNTLGKGAQPHQTFWTKRGIVRLGFFIKSERAKLFRDWAEDLVIEQLENRNTKQVIQELPQTPKRKHNRLTVERVNDIMKYVCLIEDKSLRMIITDKLYQQ